MTFIFSLHFILLVTPSLDTLFGLLPSSNSLHKSLPRFHVVRRRSEILLSVISDHHPQARPKIRSTSPYDRKTPVIQQKWLGKRPFQSTVVIQRHLSVLSPLQTQPPMRKPIQLVNYQPVMRIINQLRVNLAVIIAIQCFQTCHSR